MRVGLFAGMAEAAGCRHLDVPWTRGSVADLRAALEALQPSVGPLLARSAIAVSGRYLADAADVPAGSEVAVIPPVSGG